MLQPVNSPKRTYSVRWNSGLQGTFTHDANSERQQRKAVIKAVGIRQAKRLYRAEMRNA